MSRAQPITAYTAISYVWGDTSDAVKLQIAIDGRPARISPNLHSALVRLRDHSSSRFLWADALCIDQMPDAAGLAEKEQQVGNMDRTFSKAEHVMIDLGSTPAPEVLAVLDRFFSIPDERWEESRRIVATENFKSSFQYLAPFDLPGVQHDFWPAFAEFMQRPWFSRVWIIQEYALAAQSTFLIGTDTRPGPYLARGFLRALQYMLFLYHSDRRDPVDEKPNARLARVVWDVDQPYTAVLLIDEARRSRPQGLPLSTLLWRTKRFHATNPRDKVYAVFGLVDDAARVKDEIPIDYQSDDTHPLGAQVARYLVRTGNGAYLLYNCLGVRNEPPHPSWELVLTAPTRDGFAELYKPTGQLDHDVYQASGPTRFTCRWQDVAASASPTATTTKPMAASHLLLQVCIVDEITSLGPALPHISTMTHADLASNSSWFPQAWEWMCSVHASHSCPPQLHLQPQPQAAAPRGSMPPLLDFTLQCWQTAIADLIIPPEGEGRGYVRATKHAPSTARLCLEAIDNTARHASCVRRNVEHEFRSTMPLDGRFEAYVYTLSESFVYAFGRRLAVTRRRRFTCCVPREAEDGDVVCIVLGCPMPFVLRRVVTAAAAGGGGGGGGGGGAGAGGRAASTATATAGRVSYRIVGSCYVHGLMDGEALTADYWKEEEIEVR
ncbi:hypothetical protein G647_09281 [Cladophialophora carrionii CBS 160.54]|uniref:Heterokaryon incompatibility domain-containing protein n=1 Tax=Cladophialophora carrionii CBS 160.54 TaxID=1279043 RepID=V9D0F9_9EURO|nr:uncharacterized protein G647_09281 [Cladophialophora carrionii CBS 160.54]ETI19447.1 hypothetical protein G647_09281 [Cladophialophora carrionii CBS 160.54]